MILQLRQRILRLYYNYDIHAPSNQTNKQTKTHTSQRRTLITLEHCSLFALLVSTWGVTRLRDSYSPTKPTVWYKQKVEMTAVRVWIVRPSGRVKMSVIMAVWTVFYNLYTKKNIAISVEHAIKTNYRNLLIIVWRLWRPFENKVRLRIVRMKYRRSDQA